MGLWDIPVFYFQGSGWLREQILYPGTHSRWPQTQQILNSRPSFQKVDR